MRGGESLLSSIVPYPINTSRYATAQAELGYNASSTFRLVKYDPSQPVKVIHTVRDSADAYVESWLKTADYADIMQSLPFRLLKRVRDMNNFLDSQFKDDTTGDNPDNYLDKNTSKAAYLSHIEGKAQRAREEQERAVSF